MIAGGIDFEGIVLQHALHLDSLLEDCVSARDMSGLQKTHSPPYPHNLLTLILHWLTIPTTHYVPF